MSYDLTRERESVLEDIGNADEEIRRLGVERLLSLPAADAIPRLIESLGDPSWRVRKAAVERLVACSEVDRVTSALIEALADGENPGRRNSAVEALMAQGSIVTPALVAALSTDDIDVRKLLVDAVAGVGDPSACGPMIATLEDSDPNVRAAAADALGVLGGDDAARALLASAVSESEDQLVRFSGLRALARLESPASASQLAGVLEDSVLRPGGLALLGYCDRDEEALACLLKALASKPRAPRESAMSALLCQFSRRDGDDAAALATQIHGPFARTKGCSRPRWRGSRSLI
jgi:HEAT repeat protein